MISVEIGSKESSFAMYATTPTPSLADKSSVTFFEFVKAKPQLILIVLPYGEAVSTVIEF